MRRDTDIDTDVLFFDDVLLARMCPSQGFHKACDIDLPERRHPLGEGAQTALEHFFIHYLCLGQGRFVTFTKGVIHASETLCGEARACTLFVHYSLQHSRDSSESNALEALSVYLVCTY